MEIYIGKSQHTQLHLEFPGRNEDRRRNDALDVGEVLAYITKPCCLCGKYRGGTGCQYCHSLNQSLTSGANCWNWGLVVLHVGCDVTLVTQLSELKALLKIVGG